MKKYMEKYGYNSFSTPVLSFSNGDNRSSKFKQLSWHSKGNFSLL